MFKKKLLLSSSANSTQVSHLYANRCHSCCMPCLFLWVLFETAGYHWILLVLSTVNVFHYLYLSYTPGMLAQSGDKIVSFNHVLRTVHVTVFMSEITYLWFADDILLLSESAELQKKMIKGLQSESFLVGLKINMNKPKLMINKCNMPSSA